MPPRVHRRIDDTAAFDGEEIERSPFDYILRDYMKSRQIDWLNGHYPELTFAIVHTKPKAGETNYWAYRGRSRWIIAKWRTT